MKYLYENKKNTFDIGCLSFLLAFLCPPLWIFLYLLLYFLNKENYNDDDAETE